MIKQADDLRVGDRFPSPRADEGVVTVVEPYGQCSHDERPDSVHVKGGNGNEWFIALYDREVLHVCETVTCWLDNPVIQRATPWGETQELPHVHANAHAG